MSEQVGRYDLLLQKASNEEGLESSFVGIAIWAIAQPPLGELVQSLVCFAQSSGEYQTTRIRCEPNKSINSVRNTLSADYPHSLQIIIHNFFKQLVIALQPYQQDRLTPLCRSNARSFFIYLWRPLTNRAFQPGCTNPSGYLLRKRLSCRQQQLY